MGRIIEYACPKCKKIIYGYDEDDHSYEEGSPIGICMYCGAEYLDKRYREIALEEDNFQKEKNKESLPPDSIQLTKKGRWWTKNNKSEVKPVELNQYELSEERLSDYDYLLKLYSLDYLHFYPTAENRLIARIMKYLLPYINILEEKVGPPNRTYKLRNAETLFSQLVYEAKNSKAVEIVVREVLSHYGVDPSKYQVQVVYQEKELDKDGGTLGTFTQSKPFGGIIRVVLVPRYSEYDMVIAVILHECAHAFLYSRMINLPESRENERLTDVAAIYMGGGEYVRRGYYMYKSFRVGYLQEAESGLVYQEVEMRKKHISGIREELIERIEHKLLNPPDVSGCVHPKRVIREETVVAATQQAIMQWNERYNEIAQSVKKIKSLPLDWEPLRSVEQLEKFDKELESYEQLIRGWKEAEEYQTSFSAAKLELINGVLSMAVNKNVFAMLEMIRFWCECSATVRDAEVYYHHLIKNDSDADSLYAAGFCCLYGLVVDQNDQEGRSLLCKAAALGSKEAIKLLN